jgi:hypothetical protein
VCGLGWVRGFPGLKNETWGTRRYVVVVAHPQSGQVEMGKNPEPKNPDEIFI